MVEVCKSAGTVFNLRKTGKSDWYRIENKAAAAKPSTVHIYDEIGQFGIPAATFIQDLAETPGDLEVHINTPGGEIYDGIAIYNALKDRNPTVVIDAIAASIGSVIAMAAAPGQLIMEATADMMIHDGYTLVAGNAAELTEMAARLDKASNKIASIYAARTGQPAAYWREAMQKESWYSADEAVQAGLADQVRGGSQGQVMNHADTCPSCGHIVNASNAGWRQRDGKWVFDPDNDGDDDSTAAGDKDHDYWSADGKQLKPIPPNPATGKGGKPLAPSQSDEYTDFLVAALRDAAQPHVPMSGTHSHPHPAYGSQGSDASHDHSHSHDGDAAHSHSHSADASDHHHQILNADVDNSDWDASKAWAAGAASDDPAAFYNGICAGKKAGDPSTQAAHALPYRYTPTSPPNAAGVRNALARIDQTQGLTNKAAAQSLLEGLMKKINPDYEASDSLTDLISSMQNALIGGDV